MKHDSVEPVSITTQATLHNQIESRFLKCAAGVSRIKTAERDERLVTEHPRVMPRVEAVCVARSKVELGPVCEASPSAPRPRPAPAGGGPDP